MDKVILVVGTGSWLALECGCECSVWMGRRWTVPLPYANATGTPFVECPRRHQRCAEPSIASSNLERLSVVIDLLAHASRCSEAPGRSSPCFGPTRPSGWQTTQHFGVISRVAGTGQLGKEGVHHKTTSMSFFRRRTWWPWGPRGSGCWNRQGPGCAREPWSSIFSLTQLSPLWRLASCHATQPVLQATLDNSPRPIQSDQTFTPDPGGGGGGWG